MDVDRKDGLNFLEKYIKEFPIVAILGPRQCGKTTLARQFARRHPQKGIHFFDLENPRDLATLENPMLALEGLTGIIVIDEIQRLPSLFPLLRVLSDRRPSPAKFVILGSASPDLVGWGSETLAGRIGFLELSGFGLDLIGPSDWRRLWIRGGFPRSFLASSDEASWRWRENFISTFLERDIPNLGIHIPAAAMRRFWTMLAHYHGQIFNALELGRSLGQSNATAGRYLDLLCGAYLVRRLQPWAYNTKKRLVRKPKIYFRDSGLLHALLALANLKQLQNHPRLGSSWEGFALEEAIRHLHLPERNCFFWSVHTGGELDLVFQAKGKPWGIEVKYADAPKLTPSMRCAIQELNLTHLWVIYPGMKNYFLDKKVTAVSIKELAAIDT